MAFYNAHTYKDPRSDLASIVHSTYRKHPGMPKCLQWYAKALEADGIHSATTSTLPPNVLHSTHRTSTYLHTSSQTCLRQPLAPYLLPALRQRRPW